MHIWLTIYYNRSSSKETIKDFSTKTHQIPTLSSYKFVKYELGDFTFFSWTPSARTSKTYLRSNDDAVLGYSGTIIDDSGKAEDLRHIDHVMAKIQDIARLSGQFCIFRILKTSFTCWGDNLGSHKVFFMEIDGQILVSNYLNLLAQVSYCELDIKQFILQKVLADSGGHIGNSTHYKGIFMLPENALLTIQDGRLNISEYADLQELIGPKLAFMDNLRQTGISFKNSAEYLRKYHDAVVPLSGGFDSRVVLAMFWATEGRKINTFTYNRQSTLDFMVASKLSKDFGIPNVKVLFDPKKDRKILEGFNETGNDSDVFNYLLWMKSIKFFNASEIKVVLSGNGGDTDWAYHFSKNIDYSAISFDRLINEYSERFYQNDFLQEDFKNAAQKEVKIYIETKYGSFSLRENYIQLFGSGIFHLERFRNQGISFSQSSNKLHDTFHPFAGNDFIRTVFSAQKENLFRGNRNSIHYILYKLLTEQNAPYAPLLRENEWNDGVRKVIQNFLPFYAKVLWKLQGGDMNTILRNKYGGEKIKKVKEIIFSYPNSEIWDYLRKENLLRKLERDEIVSGIRLGRIANFLIENN